VQLSGNFGELRPNHFHAGFDFKTLQEGLEVHAAADGYFKIKISTFGNGKALYITHPNGLLVYCHLQNAAGIRIYR
jgi:murein DD-endopeptidase MepM/ murein hydrolase activator NlpD